jgi:hypothetical protein
MIKYMIASIAISINIVLPIPPAAGAVRKFILVKLLRE